MFDKEIVGNLFCYVIERIYTFNRGGGDMFNFALKNCCRGVGSFAAPRDMIQLRPAVIVAVVRPTDLFRWQIFVCKMEKLIFGNIKCDHVAPSLHRAQHNKVCCSTLGANPLNI